MRSQVRKAWSESSLGCGERDPHAGPRTRTDSSRWPSPAQVSRLGSLLDSAPPSAQGTLGFSSHAQTAQLRSPRVPVRPTPPTHWGPRPAPRVERRPPRPQPSPRPHPRPHWGRALAVLLRRQTRRDSTARSSASAFWARVRIRDRTDGKAYPSGDRKGFTFENLGETAGSSGGERRKEEARENLRKTRSVEEALPRCPLCGNCGSLLALAW